MSTKKTNDFARIRSDHRSEVVEDYLEAIADLELQNGQCRGADLARLFSVSHATVTQTLVRLREAGFIESEPYGPIGLTKKGSQVARRSRARHEIVVSFLRAVGVSESTAATDAEGIEHHVSDETLACFRKYLKRHRSANTSAKQP